MEEEDRRHFSPRRVRFCIPGFFTNSDIGFDLPIYTPIILIPLPKTFMNITLNFRIFSEGGKRFGKIPNLQSKKQNGGGNLSADLIPSSIGIRIILLVYRQYSQYISF